MQKIFLFFILSIFFCAHPLKFVYANNLEKAQKIINHFSSIQSLSADFVQFAHNGEQTKGIFFLQRPGKLRFNYQNPLRYEVISDGQSIVVLNQELKTSNLYPLSKTPLKFLLSNKIDLSNDISYSFREEVDSIFFELWEKNSTDKTKILIVLDSISYRIKRWTITDNRGEETSILLFNTKENIEINPSLFKIDYTLNRHLNEKKSYR